MYFGSVKFFKHLIVSGLILVVTLMVGGLSFVVYNYASDLIVSELSLPKPGVPGTAQALEPDDVEIDSNAEIQIVKINPFEGLVIAPYQDKYPDFYSPDEFPEEFISSDKVAYLTFDDGPSARTIEILDILKQYDIKATFFVVGNYLNTEEQKAILKRTHDEGHAIGIHTGTHEYKEIYQSVDAFLDDYYTVFVKIHEITGEYPSVFRFPGGTVNSYNKLVYKDIAREMLRRGFLYYDWHSSVGDAVKGNPPSPSTLADNALKGANGGSFIVLAHDSGNMRNTVASVPIIIERLRRKGYTFDKITNTVTPRAFGTVD